MLQNKWKKTTAIVFILAILTVISCSFAKNEAYITAFHYFGVNGDAFSIRIINNFTDNLDSPIVYVYFAATESDIDSCKFAFLCDICQTFDDNGIGKPCSNDFVKNLSMLSYNTKPKMLEYTYNKDKDNYNWELAIPLDTIKARHQMRIDISPYKGYVNKKGKCDGFSGSTTNIDITNSWSFAVHTENNQNSTYEGVPYWEKDQGEVQEAPQNPYIVLTNKGNKLWGYSPIKKDENIELIRHISPHKAYIHQKGRKLFIQTNSQNKKSLKLFDVIGNKLKEHSFNESSAEISLENLPYHIIIVAQLRSNGNLLTVQSFKIQ